MTYHQTYDWVVLWPVLMSNFSSDCNLQAFTQIDAIGSKGVLRRRELRDLLFKMVIPMGPEEFKRLWAL